MASSVGLVLELLLLLAFTAGLLHHYKDAQVGFLVYGFVFVSWYAGFLGLVLLPLDISTTALHGEAVVHSSLLVGWKLVYWLTFFLSWVILPVLIEYCQSGAFSPEQKLRTSIRYLLRHYALLLTIGAVLLVYLVVVDHFTVSGLVGLAMTLANTYGLLWIIALLGHGFVSVPRKVWAFASPTAQLRETYFRAIQIHDDRVESMFIYEDVVRDVQAMLARFHVIEQSTIILTPELQHIKECLRHVSDTMGVDVEAGKKRGAPLRPPPRRAQSSSGLIVGAAFVQDEPLPTEDQVIALHGRTKRIKSDLRRCEQAWQDICWTAQRLATWSTDTSWTSQHGIPYAASAAAVLCAAASAVIMWSELVMGWDGGWLSPLGEIVLHAAPGLGLQLLLLLVLLYMGVCAYQSLFSIRGFGRLALHGGQNSTELSLLTTSVQQCRLQFSLGYNFLLLLNCDRVTHATAFHALFSDMRLIHFFGTDFSLYAPLCMLAIAAMTFWQGYARLVKSLGLEQYENLIPGQIEHEAKIHQGEALVQKGIEKYMRLKARSDKAAAESAAALSDGLTEALLD
ncbi:Aste57867_13070 [Aphanomyces stellatus]|uniref:Aste57867_13070 protein n=1 Tax=Aphanomyces stellatus TaxID=120398 RepID=A0A485KX71_9STRA|nr:hypothetical protein As57867_013022 [Aphanomyces stellatus]VFT89914.1 Aste57867_13070 [Aphanomyces stellatus]